MRLYPYVCYLMNEGWIPAFPVTATRNIFKFARFDGVHMDGPEKASGADFMQKKNFSHAKETFSLDF
ncbi:hypothetical protein FACS1894158_09370 [Betaproteobacteria bacterium]|nr:hypothetical protein FACS1894158_09370 [Betaproteobacteria bacterium]